MQPRIGIAVYIRNQDNQVLLGKRKQSHGTGTWAVPGGHLEFGETPESCAQREVLEETGLLIAHQKLMGVTNDIFQQENKHYITLHMLSDISGGALALREPHKCEQWKWFKPTQMPDPLFLTIRNFVNQNPKWFSFNTIQEK